MLPSTDLEGATLHSLVGGCPRDIDRFLTDPLQFEREIRTSIESLETSAVIRDLVKGLSITSAPSALSHALILLDRAKAFDISDNSSLGSDPEVIRLKGDLVFAPLIKRLMEFDDVAQQRLLAALTGAALERRLCEVAYLKPLQCDVSLKTLRQSTPMSSGALHL